MKNLEHIKYTYKHRKIVIKLGEKYFPDNQELMTKLRYHDLDKLFLYLFYDKKDVSRLHRDLTSHHENNLHKNKLDYIEMVLDWESARYTKPDKPLNAYDTLINYYQGMESVIMPILEEMGINKSNLPMDEDILKLAQELDDVSIEEIVNELKESINLLTTEQPKKLILE